MEGKKVEKTHDEQMRRYLRLQAGTEKFEKHYFLQLQVYLNVVFAKSKDLAIIKRVCTS